MVIQYYFHFFMLYIYILYIYIYTVYIYIYLYVCMYINTHITILGDPDSIHATAHRSGEGDERTGAPGLGWPGGDRELEGQHGHSGCM